MARIAAASQCKPARRSTLSLGQRTRRLRLPRSRLSSSACSSEAVVSAAVESGPRVRPRGQGGRPSRLQSAQLSDRILDVATALFLGDGFGATSIEAVAKHAGISKRTFYHRFRGKEELFQSVVRRLIERWMPPFDAALFEGPSL